MVTRSVAFVRQANIAHGLQQEDNGPAPTEWPRAGETNSQPNGLLGLNERERLDTGTAGIAGRADFQLAPAGALNRTED